MFDNNGPVAAKNRFHTYLATVGLGALPEESRDRFADLNTKGPFDVLSDGTESLYAALVEDIGLPDKPTALSVLGEMAQAAAAAQLSGEVDRWMAIRQWAANELVPLPEGIEAPEAPVVKQEASFQPAPEEAPPAPPVAPEA